MELPLPVNTSLSFCAFCWFPFFFFCNVSNKQIVLPAVWHEGIIMCSTRVNWAMSLSGCGIPTLKLKICLLRCEVQTSLSDWGVKRQDYIGCWQAADARWNSRGHDGFSPGWCKVMLFQVATNMSSIVIFEVTLFIIITNSMHISMCCSTYLYSKVLPSVFPALWTLAHH